MRHLFTLMLLLAFCSFSYGQVNRAEYFVDNDPGLGKATPVSFTPGTDITSTFNVSLKNVASGFHTLYVRTRDAQGKWSLTNSSIFLNSEITSQNRTIDKAEYFVDNDPGIGKATAVNITPGADITTKFTAPLNSLATGFHTFYVRAHDAQGKWSLTNSSIFFNSEITNANKVLEKAEYYVDNDPGLGKGTAVTVPAGQKDANVNFKVDTRSLSNGVHTLNVRVLDNGKSWSPNSQHIFVVKSGGIENIVSLKYNFIRAGFVSDINTYLIPTPSPSIDLNFKADLSKLTADQEYTMQIYAVTESGAQSLAYTKKVKVCSGKPAKAVFDYIALGTQVSFIDSSVNALKYRWIFGDGKTDSVSNPMHNYSTGGTYEVKLITSNFCNNDTLIKKINVVDIQSIFPKSGGNAGTVTINLTGKGLTDKTLVSLVNGGTQIIGSFVRANPITQSLQATFNLIDKEIGDYDLELKTENSTTEVKAAFKVEKPIKGEINIDIIGRNTIRMSRDQNYKIYVSNTTNKNVKGVLTFLAFPKGTIVNFENYVVDYGQSKLSYTTDSLFTNKIDSVDIYPLLIPVIFPNSEFIISVNINTKSSSEFKIKAWAYPALYGSPLNTNADNCLAQAIKDAVIAPTPIPCIIGVKDLAQNTVADDQPYALIANENALNAPGAIDKLQNGLVSFYGKAATAVTGCGDISIPEVAEKKIKYLFNLFKALTSGFSTYYDCKVAFSPTKSKDLTVKPVASNDPNLKVGPTASVSGNYNQGKSTFNYTIYFENLNTATAPAQEVVVIDTLDKNVFDLASFKLNGSAFGKDFSNKIVEGLNAYSTNIDLRPAKNLIVRVDAKLDTTKGILKWRFLSLDPATMEITDDPLAGFLPPNKTSPEGEGYISCSIQPKTNLPSGTQIKNKAVIYFDNNKPITTNTFLNNIDKINPVSKVVPLTASTTDSTFTVRWAGTDQGAGVRSYDIQYAVNGGAFKLWLYDINSTEAVFTGKKDSTYKFFSIAKDYAGNIEDAKTQEEASTTIKIIKPQTITFPAITGKTFGDPDFDLGATASSALPITYTTNNPAVATVVNGKLHIASAGTVIITASQAGNQDYTAALPVSDTLLIKKAAQTLTFPTILSKNYNDPDFNPNATASSGLPVTYTSSNPAVLTIVNGLLHIVATGTSTITATQAGNSNYLAATSISQDIQVIFSLPADNFTIGAVSASCKGSSNGEINLTAASVQNYTATVTSGASSTTYPFTGQLSVKNLHAGTYSVCVTISTYPAYKQCFDIVVTEPKDLSVYSVVNPTLGTLSLNLSGASSYNIILNGTVYTTTQSNINLPLEPGSNVIKVTTSSICQGIYEKTIQLPPGVLAYPNPFERMLSLSIGNDHSSTATIEVYDIKGQKVYAGKSSINQGKCSLDLGNLAPGSYVLKLILDHSETNIKIIKK